LFGTGPGTFGKAYEKVKRPESEMARLAHNDYLQQATDSGIPSFILYAVFIVGAMIQIYWRGDVRKRPMKLAIWLGLLGWSLQGLAEFGLYIPALAWPVFAFIGWQLADAGAANAIDNPKPAP
jgi:O-antigen ligase